jgi:hypothetical protein
MQSFRYLAEDLSWNDESSMFALNLHSDVIPAELIDSLNESIRYELFNNGVIAVFQQPQLSAIIYCRCKVGDPVGELAVRFDSGARLEVQWPGVNRIFVRVRIMDLTLPETMIEMLQDCIRNGHSMSDVEEPERNQSFRPWSESEEDSNSSDSH